MLLRREHVRRRLSTRAFWGVCCERVGPLNSEPVPPGVPIGGGGGLRQSFDGKVGHGSSHGSVTVSVTIQDVSQSRLVTLEDVQSPFQSM